MAPGRGVPVQLDRERHIRYPMAAVAEMEEKYDFDFMGADGLPTDSHEDVVWLVWLGLKHAGETVEHDAWWRRLLCRWGLIEPRPVQVEDVAEWIDMTNLADVVDAYIRAFGGEEIDGEVAPPDVGKRRMEAG